MPNLVSMLESKFCVRINVICVNMIYVSDKITCEIYLLISICVNVP